ncbi:L,D-transpeptidase family protein [Kaistia dalseonensis]|uniref:Murein L,D-transpeptidase YcbB/YkuD n=1 Tax=Kaistia dalseonensis TaxID=410840 RepID=A0ABU0HB52_9HYPH|nr:L,D-transpeptidase family protein [Kaistia dalseonensis]MCX5496589.1 L,D-transpeptidase family protein [Kaistia dalseonensis]MDQ0439212.1 murein L,D-transpeptidase YcbB/YkuD [Kaistia dalseonensis]
MIDKAVIDKALKALLASAALIGLSVGSAHAYLPEGKTFRERAGSAASLTMADVASDPAAQALKIQIATPEGKESFLEKRDRAAMAEFYAERDYQPVWLVDGKYTPAALKVMDRIAAASEDGLDPAAYHLPPRTIGASVPAGPDVSAAAEATLSRALLLYARQAYAGRVDPASLGKLVTIKPLLPDPIEVLGTVSASADPVAAVASFNPPHPGYAKLRTALAAARAAQTGPAPTPVPDGKAMKLGMSDPRVPLLRARLGLPAADAAAADANLYDNTVAEAVAKFQAVKGLKADGVAGGNTLAFLNGEGKDKTAEIIANMERWRWLPRDLGDFHVEVNIPEFEVRVFNDGKVVHQTRVVTGKVTNQTPIFSDEMESIVVNPSWNVPASITMKEMLPAIRRDPSYLSRQGYQVLASVNGKFRPVDPGMVDWSNVSAGKIQIRQPPGDDNALGSIKFLFPNQHSVYLHDTPSKSLFSKDVRAFSHGCVRVQNPLEFADVLLAYEGGWTSQRLRKMIGGKESWVNLPKHIPIHLVYFTAFVDDNGRLETRPDIYGYEARVEKALGL